MAGAQNGRRAARPLRLERLTPNVAAFPHYPWRQGAVGGTVLHASRSALDVSPDEGWVLTLRYFSQVGNNFAHVVMGPPEGQGARIQRDESRARHGGSDRAARPDAVYGLNAAWRAIELAEPRPCRGFTAWQCRAVAYLVAQWHTRDHLALGQLPSLDATRSVQGLVGHEDTTQGRCYGKSDRGGHAHGGAWDWERFLARVERRRPGGAEEAAWMTPRSWASLPKVGRHADANGAADGGASLSTGRSGVGLHEAQHRPVAAVAADVGHGWDSSRTRVRLTTMVVTPPDAGGGTDAGGHGRGPRRARLLVPR